MKGVVVVFLSAVVLLFASSALASEEASEVVVLTDADFDQKIAEGTWLVEFYAPWCGHCKKLAPTWEETAKALKGQVNVAKVDCTVNKATQTRFGIRGFPTIKLIKDNKVYDFKGSRNMGAFADFALSTYSSFSFSDLPKPGAVQAEKKEQKEEKVEKEVKAEAKQDGASDVVVLTQANFAEQVSQGDWLLEFYAPWCGHCKKLAPIWEQLATSLKGKVNVGKVDCTVEKNLATAFAIRGFPTIKFSKGGKLYDYKGQRTVQDFTSFAETGYSSAEANDFPASYRSGAAGASTEAVPAEPEKTATEDSTDSAVVVLSSTNFADHIKEGTWFIEFYAPWCGHCKNLAPTWEKLAKEVKGKFNVGKVDATVEQQLAKSFSIGGYPTLLLVKDGKVYNYKGNGQRTIPDFLKFVEGGYQKIENPASLPEQYSGIPKDEL